MPDFTHLSPPALPLFPAAPPPVLLTFFSFPFSSSSSIFSSSFSTNPLPTPPPPNAPLLLLRFLFLLPFSSSSFSLARSPPPSPPFLSHASNLSPALPLVYLFMNCFITSGPPPPPLCHFHQTPVQLFVQFKSCLCPLTYYVVRTSTVTVSIKRTETTQT